jgi:hypothetical protein
VFTAKFPPFFLIFTTLGKITDKTLCGAHLGYSCVQFLADGNEILKTENKKGPVPKKVNRASATTVYDDWSHYPNWDTSARGLLFEWRII